MPRVGAVTSGTDEHPRADGPGSDASTRDSGTRARPQRGTAVVRLVAVAYALLLAAFVMSNPAGLASDEPSHFYRAAALAHGQVLGGPVRIVADAAQFWGPDQLDWVTRTARVFRVPERYTGCDAFRFPHGGRCVSPLTALDRPLAPGTQVSYVGTYPPLAYVPAAAGIRVAEVLRLGLDGAVRLARAGEAVVCLALLRLAVGLLRNRRGGSARLVGLVGVPLVLTPIVLFTASQVTDSGIEICAAVCLVAGLLRLGDDTPAPRWVYAAVGSAALLLATARSTGPAWLLLVVLALLLARPRAYLATVRRAPVASTTAAAVMVVGAAAGLAWQYRYEPRPDPQRLALGHALAVAWHRLPDVAELTIGRLGWLHVELGPVTVGLWWAGIVGLLALALVLGSWYERAVLVAVVAGVVALDLAVDVLLVQASSPGFEMQPRYVYAVAVVVPLLSADVAGRRLARLARGQRVARLLGAGTLVLCPGLLAAGVIANGKAYRAAPYTPPALGWAIWDGVALLAAALALVAAGLLVGARAPGTTAGERLLTPKDSG